MAGCRGRSWAACRARFPPVRARQTRKHLPGVLVKIELRPGSGTLAPDRVATTGHRLAARPRHGRPPRAPDAGCAATPRRPVRAPGPTLPNATARARVVPRRRRTSLRVAGALGRAPPRRRSRSRTARRIRCQTCRRGLRTAVTLSAASVRRRGYARRPDGRPLECRRAAGQAASLHRR